MNRKRLLSIKTVSILLVGAGLFVGTRQLMAWPTPASERVEVVTSPQGGVLANNDVSLDGGLVAEVWASISPPVLPADAPDHQQRMVTFVSLFQIGHVLLDETVAQRAVTADSNSPLTFKEGPIQSSEALHSAMLILDPKAGDVSVTMTPSHMITVRPGDGLTWGQVMDEKNVVITVVPIR